MTADATTLPGTMFLRLIGDGDELRDYPTAVAILGAGLARLTR